MSVVSTAAPAPGPHHAAAIKAVKENYSTTLGINLKQSPIDDDFFRRVEEACKDKICRLNLLMAEGICMPPMHILAIGSLPLVAAFMILPPAFVIQSVVIYFLYLAIFSAIALPSLYQACKYLGEWQSKFYQRLDSVTGGQVDYRTYLGTFNSLRKYKEQIATEYNREKFHESVARLEKVIENRSRAANPT